jgi:phenylalanyl-tRNA synthetase alpha chain
LHEYETEILKLLKEEKSASLPGLESRLKLGRDSIVWALENLAKSNAVSIARKSAYGIEMSSEGKGYLKQFPEEALAKALVKGGMPLEKIGDRIGLIWAKKNGWLEITGKDAKLSKEGALIADGKKDYATRKLMNDLGSAQGDALEHLLSSNKEAVQLLSNRNLIKLKERSEITEVSITKSGSALLEQEAGKGIGQLTREIMKSRKWQSEGLRGYDINAPTEPEYAARLHPMHELIDRIRNIWYGMGFVETSGPIIEPAFWVFDALFEPQDHPARDMQDTFYLSNPKTIDIDDVELISKFKKEHTAAWNEAWQEDLAKQALLRTQATSVSAHQIRRLASATGIEYPLKLFSVGKVFRNESVDYKHLAELHQFDGIIIGNNLTLANLIETLKRFYAQLGITEVKLGPSYFPFVEPGMEMYYYDKELGDTIELCGAGIIRKEITRAMGIKMDVLAWGGGIERFMFKFLGIKSITDIYKNDIGWLRERRELTAP